MSFYGINKSYNTGDINTINNYTAGGLVGEQVVDITTFPNSITQSYSTGNVTTIGNAGGLIGSNAYLTIEDSYATGSVTSYANNAGGIVGSAAVTSTYTRNFATGAVSGGTGQGGIAGEDLGATATDNFYDSVTTTMSSDALASGSTAHPTSNMQTQGTFTNFDFNTLPVWKISADEYPKLDWQP